MTNSLRRAFLLFAVASATVSALMFLPVFHTLATLYTFQQLHETAVTLARLWETHGRLAPLPTAQNDALRITVIDAAGRVQMETHAAAAAMENLSDRDEMRAALSAQEGHATHLSRTLHVPMLFVAVPLHAADGHVCGALRVSSAAASVTDAARVGWAWLVVLLALVVGVALAIAQNVARTLNAPLERLYRAVLARTPGPLAEEGPEEVRRLAQVINETRRELAEQDRMRRDFVANASHELRTPVGALVAALEMLDRAARNDASQRDDLLDRARRAATRLHRLSSDLLDLSAAEASTTPGQCDAVQECGEQAERFLAAATDKQQALDLVLPREPLQVAMSAHDLGRVIGNLLDNAVKFTSVGGTLALHVRRHESQIEIAVLDSGPGIPAGDLERVFERFYRVDASRSEGGSGLGLALARHLVTRAGGRIRAANRPQGGTCVTVDLALI